MPPDPSRLVDDLESTLRPLEVAHARAWWEAATTGSDEAMERKAAVDRELRTLLGDRDRYADVNAALAAEPAEPWRRQLQLLRDAMAPNQVVAELRQRIVDLESAVERTFTTHRGEIDGERVDDNAIEAILSGSGDVALRRHAWEASKSVGEAVAPDLLALVRLRNEAARSIGYDDYWAMSLAVGELDEDRLVSTLDEVAAATAGPFATWKADLDAALAERYGVGLDDLRPWHYDDPFFQQPPRAGRVGLDDALAGADLPALTLRTYDRLGIDLTGVMERSDLYAREGKNQHAFCIDVDREGDVRVLANVLVNERWTETMLHEFGHAAYEVGLDPALPWFLRTPAHSLTTEAVAMLFGRLARDPEWLVSVAGRPAAEVEALAAPLAASRRAGILVFVRWALVVVHFERHLYRQPDADHVATWWDLVERFQGVRRPDGRTAPDWASKIHLAVAPVYYQNYLYGELIASQLDAALRERAGGLVDRPEAGRWLVDAVFRPGASLTWSAHLAEATGHPLTARHVVEQLGAR